MRPHKRQPTRLRRSWDSPGKNTGVRCHFLLQYRKVKSESEVAQSCLTLRDPMDCSLPGSSVCRIFQARVLEWGAIAFYKPGNTKYCLQIIRSYKRYMAQFLPWSPQKKFCGHLGISSHLPKQLIVLLCYRSKLIPNASIYNGDLSFQFKSIMTTFPLALHGHIIWEANDKWKKMSNTPNKIQDIPIWSVPVPRIFQRKLINYLVYVL